MYIKTIVWILARRETIPRLSKDAFEQDRYMARAIKQGMMQQLLTGRVRLIIDQEASEHVR